MAHPPSRRGLLLTLALATGLSAQVEPTPVAASLDPTAEETEVLFWINRFRRDPAAFARLVRERHRPDNAGGVDWQRFVEEVAALPPAPPLGFVASLGQAARAHARYTVKAEEYGHRETPGRAGFTGTWPHDRARAAGYTTPVAECAIANGGRGLAVVANYVVDAAVPGTGTAGMQDGRGHRRCLADPRWREVGVAMFGWGAGHWSNVTLCGETSAAVRILGGVVFDDRDGDGCYDAGEGLGGAHLRVGEHATLASPSGAFRLDLPRDTAARRLEVHFGGLQVERDLTPSTQDESFELVVGVRQAVAELETALASPAMEAPEARRRVLLRLQPLRAPANDGERELAAAVAAAQTSALAQLGTGSRSDVERALQTGRRAWAGTVVETWWTSAARVDRLLREAESARTAGDARTRARRRAAAAANVARAMAEVVHPDLWRRLDACRRASLPN